MGAVYAMRIQSVKSGYIHGQTRYLLQNNTISDEPLTEQDWRVHAEGMEAFNRIATEDNARQQGGYRRVNFELVAFPLKADGSADVAGKVIDSRVFNLG